MRTVLGVNLDEEVAPLFESATPGTVLLCDGDGAAYRAAATTKTLATAYRRFLQEVLTDQFLTKTAVAEVYLTASSSNKADRNLYPTYKPYQGNRNGKRKPPLLEPLRQFLENSPPDLPDGMEIGVERYWEADDRLIMRAHVLGSNGVIRSDDKDLRLTPGPYFDNATGTVLTIPNRYGWIAEGHTEAGHLRVKGHGTKFFWAQMLMGDTADNVRGLDRLDGKLVGERGALDYLVPIDCEVEAANRILWAYARHKQDALAEAQMLWLRRSESDCAYEYFMELDLDVGLKQWLTQLHEYHQKHIAYHREIV